MSSRTESDDPWLRQLLRTADCGPRPALPADCGGRQAGMTTGRQQGGSDSGQSPRQPREGEGWQILSYMLGGMILYGGIGWLVGRLTGLSFLFPVGMIVGIGLSVGLIIFRFTRS